MASESLASHDYCVFIYRERVWEEEEEEKKKGKRKKKRPSVFTFKWAPEWMLLLCSMRPAIKRRKREKSGQKVRHPLNEREGKCNSEWSPAFTQQNISSKKKRSTAVVVVVAAAADVPNWTVVSQSPLLPKFATFPFCLFSLSSLPGLIICLRHRSLDILLYIYYFYLSALISRSRSFSFM